ncbi:hypothetical protein [Ulvibacterium marinum]|uniref:hypothetical protein n=1 Tax=Ulvibacterium marinum TaxID=2419782 RepID=UPI00249473FF|nr:hypothetical protein [Ulvibacterium marinum]
MHRTSCFLVFFIMYAQSYLQAQDAPILASEKWGKGIGLQQPESIIFDAKNGCFYVSNGKKFAPGTDGFLSKFDKNGSLVQLKWVDSLSRPTGMALHKDQLWVADVNALKVVDTSSGKVLKTYPEPVKNSGLNDISINTKGELFVTASFTHSVLKMEGEELIVWLQDEAALEWANGIYAQDNQLLVGGTHLSRIDLSTKQILQLKTSPPIKDIDGLWPTYNGGYLLSTVENSALWYLDTEGKAAQLVKDDFYLGDLQFMTATSTVYVPRGDHKDGIYFVAAFKLKFP